MLLTLYTASEKDAERYAEIKTNEHYKWVRLDGAKSNLSLITGDQAVTWYSREGVKLANGEPVGVLQPHALTKVQSNVEKQDAFEQAIIEAIHENQLLDKTFQWTDILDHMTQTLGKSRDTINKNLRRKYDAGDHELSNEILLRVTKVETLGTVFIVEALDLKKQHFKRET
jgi:hypothetical protein